MHIYGIQKDGTDEIICREAMETKTQRHIEETYGQGAGVGTKETVRYMERVIQKLTLAYVKYIANGNLLYDSGNSNRGSVTTQRGGIGREMPEGQDMCPPMADSC